MSITSLIFALLPAIVAGPKPKPKPKPKPRPEPEPDPELILDRMWVAFRQNRLEAEVARLTEESARLRAENAWLRDRERRENWWRSAQANQALQQQAQQLARHQQNQPGQYSPYDECQPLQGLEYFCNCAPDRAELLTQI